jgi:hypothetical protein
MKHLIIGIVLALGLTSTVTAQTVANGPYYAMPAWDQTLPPAQRFIVLANFNQEAVLDRETGLVWQRTAYAFSAPNPGSASGVCKGATTGNRLGWRLPTINELQSLFDPTVTPVPFQAPLPAGHPFTLNLPNTFWVLWTATPEINSPSTFHVAGWVAGSMGAGFSVYGFRTTDTSGRVLCVRGGLMSGAQ